MQTYRARKKATTRHACACCAMLRAFPLILSVWACGDTCVCVCVCLTSSGGVPRPGQIQMNPSFSAHGSAATATLRQNAVEGILVQWPSPLNCQPWYAHTTWPLSTLPRDKGHARCAHVSLMQAGWPFSSRKSTQFSLKSSIGTIMSLASVCECDTRTQHASDTHTCMQVAPTDPRQDSSHTASLAQRAVQADHLL